MTWVDYTILGILLVSGFVSLMRGFVREALSLAGWTLAFWVALMFSGPLADMLKGAIPEPTLRLVVAFLVLLVLTLVATAAANFFAAKLVQRSGLTSADRFIGVLFGLLRGVVIVAVLVLLAGLTALPAQPWWQQSLLLENFVAIAVWLREFLPSDVAASFKF
ncbi:MAG: CvpA family protein [Pseudomonadota bacterium]|nr:MAG: CvpA family protein [Pseudomonadota bacterium]